MNTDVENHRPYVGPRPFERGPEDSLRFFGREIETREIVALVLSHPVILVYAQSGAGKTSLFNARIAPALEDNWFEVLPVTRVNGAIPDGIDIAKVRNVYVFNALSNLNRDADPNALLTTSLHTYLEQRPRAKNPYGSPVPRAVIFDQMEEIYTVYHSDTWLEHQQDFFSQITEALNADPLLRVVLIIREDYLASFEPFARFLPDGLRTRFRLERLDEWAALEAVTRPLQNTSRYFAEGVAEKLGLPQFW
jgi:hypothetical protein